MKVTVIFCSLKIRALVLAKIQSGDLSSMVVGFLSQHYCGYPLIMLGKVSIKIP